MTTTFYRIYNFLIIWALLNFRFALELHLVKSALETIQDLNFPFNIQPTNEIEQMLPQVRVSPLLHEGFKFRGPNILKLKKSKKNQNAHENMKKTSSKVAHNP